MAQDRAQLLITAVDQTKAAFDSIRGNLSKLGDEANRVKGLLAGLGVSLSVAGFVAMIKSAIDAADQLNKLSQKIGISVEALSTLRYAAQLADVDLETLQTSIKTLSQNISEANAGIGDGAEVFKALGISVKNADGSVRSTEDVLLQVASVFSRMEDGAVKSALAVKLFGRNGLEMIPFLNLGADGINRLTAEAERLGLKLTTATAQAAETFNDNLIALKASSSSLSIALANDLLPELVNITSAMREAANEAGILKALWVGLGGIGDLIFNGTEIKQARDEIKRLQDLVDSTRKKVETGRARIPFTPFDIKFNEQAMATLRKNLAQWEGELAAAKKRLEDLLNPRLPQTRVPKSKPTDEIQRVACVLSGGQWVDGQCQKKSAAAEKTVKDTTAAQLAFIKAQADAEFSILKQGLGRAQAAYEAALEDRLISIRDFYAAKTAIEQREIDAEIARTQALLTEQQRIAAKGKDESERIRAKGEVKKLEAELIVLNDKRAAAEQANARKAAQAERELADALAQAREELASITGQATDADRRAAIERQFRDLRARLAAEGDAQGVSLIDRLIDVKAAQANLQALEAEWRLVTERMRNAQEAIQTQQQAGLLTEAQARQQIVELQQQSAAEMERLLPAMQQSAQAIGPEAVERVRAFATELSRTKLVVNDIAVTINGQFQDAFTGLFESVISGTKSAKQAFLDFGRSILATINRIIAQKFAEQLFAGFGGKGGGIGGAIADFFKGFKFFAAGGYVSGPGTSTSDSIPARLSAGEYVVRAAAVRKFGVAFLDAINGLRVPPSVISRRLAFASGGLVPSVGVGEPPVVVQMTIQTPDASSFRRSQGQIAAEMRLALERARRNL